VTSGAPRGRVLLIGWDAADWKLINPLLDAGLMPSLAGLIERGVIGNLTSLEPMLSPMLWTSIATGKTADRHGILGFMEPDPGSGKVRPVTSTSRRVKALWNMATQHGLRSHVVSWLAGHPAEPILGASVSPLYPLAKGQTREEWKMPADCVHPAGLAETLADLRLHTAEIGAREVRPFVPKAAQVDQEKDRRLATIAKVLAECCSTHNAATWLMENEPWDLCAVYYDAIDHFCHGFVPFHPPAMQGLPPELVDLYGGVVAGAYRFHDMMLERLLQLAGPETTVIIVSDHGFHSDHLRPPGIPEEPAGPTVFHRESGIFCMAGPGVRKDERIYGASLLDITPTVLTLLGMPIGRDMPGRVLVEAFEEKPATEHIASWEEVAGPCGMHSPDMRTDADSLLAMTQQFADLGYIEMPGEDQAKALTTVVREQHYNLARVYLDLARGDLALPLAEDLLAAEPESERFRMLQARALMSIGRRDEAAAVLLKLAEGGKRAAWSEMLLGLIRLDAGDVQAGLSHLLRAERSDPLLPTLHVQIGGAYLRADERESAERAFLKAVEIDADSAVAHLGLSRTYLRQRRDPDAAREALTAVGLEHRLPLGHLSLGIALARLGHFERAEAALRMALSQSPRLRPAHRYLAALERLKQPAIS
jgi:predicted AlkP superfamily phosphohydrolase/phosphomutase/tetratricopeptide (TPR) repeat protein